MFWSFYDDFSFFVIIRLVLGHCCNLKNIINIKKNMYKCMVSSRSIRAGAWRGFRCPNDSFHGSIWIVLATPSPNSACSLITFGLVLIFLFDFNSWSCKVSIQPFNFFFLRFDLYIFYLFILFKINYKIRIYLQFHPLIFLLVRFNLYFFNYYLFYSS